VPFGFGIGELILVVLALLLLFGARRIPGIARALGESIRNFKGEVRGPKEPDDDERPRRLDDGERRP